MLKRRWTIWGVPNKLDLKGNCSLEAKVAGKDKSEKENDDNQDHRHQGRHGRLAAHIVHTHLEVKFAMSNSQSNTTNFHLMVHTDANKGGLMEASTSWTFFACGQKL